MSRQEPLVFNQFVNVRNTSDIIQKVDEKRSISDTNELFVRVSEDMKTLSIDINDHVSFIANKDRIKFQDNFKGA
ncbi:MAG: hypothetical protein H3C64_00690 [Candidatus Kuenenia stuttgartiensis]|nr:hypothetical protein [Candidatus Kuenenia stuttgartiensis]